MKEFEIQQKNRDTFQIAVTNDQFEQIFQNEETEVEEEEEKEKNLPSRTRRTQNLVKKGA